MIAAPAEASSTTGEWNFQVLLDGRPIGSHRFVVTQHGDEVNLLSEAEFKVTVFAVPLYSYHHTSRESFEGDCLQMLNASTAENSSHRVVQGLASDSAFTVTTEQGATRLPACVMTFDYWNPDILKQSHLLNPQSGAYQAVLVTYVGSELLMIRGSAEMAEAYLLAAGDMRIKIWYSADTHWLGLESRLSDGRLMRYQLR